jgi:hypothetical protein
MKALIQLPASLHQYSDLSHSGAFNVCYYNCLFFFSAPVESLETEQTEAKSEETNRMKADGSDAAS